MCMYCCGLLCGGLFTFPSDIGDHLHNDLVEPVRQLGWRSCAIVSELAKEIAVQNSSEYKHLLASAHALQVRDTDEIRDQRRKKRERKRAINKGSIRD